MSNRVDVLILGGGFGGSLLSLMLVQRGLQVALVDAAAHPRFAIGESSTPLASRTLKAIAAEFDLPELEPLSSWGRWKEELPDIGCGRKRGFTYLNAANPKSVSGQMLVAASQRDELADTHWLRRDVDHWLFELAAVRGVRTFERTGVQPERVPNGWRLRSLHATFDIEHAEFVVDATGGAKTLLRSLEIPDDSRTLQTNSRAVFGHFQNLTPLEELIPQDVRAQHPFDCGAAAVHVVLRDRWMWQLRFDDGTVSCGITGPLKGQSAPNEIWNATIRESELLQQQFACSNCLRPASGLRSSSRLQRLTTQAAGPTWAALPATAGFVDPLHSTGIAHTLIGVARLVEALTTTRRETLLEQYSGQVLSEIRHVDRLVAGCYAGLPSFDLWCTWCMLYFAAATSGERSDAATDFLHASSSAFCEMLTAAESKLATAISIGSDESTRQFQSEIAELIEPWNSAGLLDATAHPFYSSTAVPEN